MGSVLKKIKGGAKKLAKNIRKPISKITKGIARGIAKVGKSVMRGISRITKKLGPIGMIGLSIAMPYALHGLSSMVGTAAMSGVHPATGLMAKKGFLGAIGQVGNQIRTGYQFTTGAIGNTWSTITKSISNTFQKFQTGTGNVWTKISNGAKRLYTSARNQVAKLKKFTPKFRQGQLGQVELKGIMGRHGPISSLEAQSLIDRGVLQGSDIYSQTLGSPEGWFTHGSSQTDSLITDTINEAIQPRLKMLDKNGLDYYNNLKNTSLENLGRYSPNEALDTVINSKGTTRNFATDFSKTPDSYTTNLAKTGDYTLGTARDRLEGTYNFTGAKTYNNSVGKSSIKKASQVSNLKKGMKYAAGKMAKSLLTQDSAYKLPEVMSPSIADMTHQTTSGYGGTEIEGAWGGSLLRGAFNDNQRERIMNFYKNMNIIGSH